MHLRDNGLPQKKPAQKITLDASFLQEIKQELQGDKTFNTNTQKANIVLADTHSQSKKVKLSKIFKNIDFLFTNEKNQKIFLVIDLNPSKEALQSYLSQKNILITYKNSSPYCEHFDYLQYGSDNEIIQIISLYYNNPTLYKAKLKKIKQSQIPSQILKEKTLVLQKNSKKLQFVFISIYFENLQATIQTIDKYCDFVKEYIIVTSPKNIDIFQNLKTKHSFTIIDETSILDKEIKNFASKDHQSKNFLLRASLANLEILEEEFIMLDDDNQMLKPISKEKFISKEGKYKAYYFHDLLKYHHNITPYDKGQQNTKEILLAKNYKQLLSYSSHCPQIINKSIYKEAIQEFYEISLVKALDEWSIYFNYALTHYPHLFIKQVFQTLNWPASPYQFTLPFTQDEISFENYYKELYETKFFTPSNTYEEKLAIKKRLQEPFTLSKELFNKNKQKLIDSNMIHGVFSFINKEISFYLLSIPYYIVLKKDCTLSLILPYKLQSHLSKAPDISLVIFQDKNYKTLRKIPTKENTPLEENTLEFPISSKNLQEGIYDISFNILYNKSYIYKNTSPHKIKLIVSKD